MMSIWVVLVVRIFILKEILREIRVVRRIQQKLFEENEKDAFESQDQFKGELKYLWHSNQAIPSFFFQVLAHPASPLTKLLFYGNRQGGNDDEGYFW